MAKELFNAAQIQAAPVGRHCDGKGLYFEVKASGARRWFLRYSFGGIRPYPKVTLKAARDQADEWRRQIDAG